VSSWLISRDVSRAFVFSSVCGAIDYIVPLPRDLFSDLIKLQEYLRQYDSTRVEFEYGRLKTTENVISSLVVDSFLAMSRDKQLDIHEKADISLPLNDLLLLLLSLNKNIP
jgi:hypothetical protein